MKQLKEIIKDHFGHVKINKEWVRDFEDWYRGIVNKNEHHVNFFGGLLLGVYDVKFETEDFNYIWDILLESEKDVIASAVVAVKEVDKDWEVVSNVNNHAFIIMMHLVETSSLPSKQKKSIILRLLVLFQFKFITSRHFNDWPHLANKEIALATYTALSNQFKLKQYASWSEYLHSRALEMYLGGERRKDFLTLIHKYDDDLELIRILSGVSTNIGKVLNRWNKVYYQMHEAGNRLSLTSNLGSDGEGGNLLKDLDGIAKYRVYAESNIGNTSKFVNSELVDVIVKTSRLRSKDFINTLTYLSDNYQTDNETGKFALGALNYGLNRLLDERKDLKDIATVYRFLANAYGNSRSTSPNLENIRKRGVKLLEASEYKNPKSSVVTVVCTYIVIWTLLKK